MKWSCKKFVRNMLKLISFCLVECILLMAFVYAFENSTINQYHKALEGGQSWFEYCENN